MKCKRCGAEIADDSKFCEFCGKRVKHRVWLLAIIVIIILMVCGVLGYNLNKAYKYTPTPETVNTDNEAHSISVMSSDETMGYVKGAGTYNVNSNAKIEAVAYEGYRFVSWNDGNTMNPRVINVIQNKQYIATFEKKSIGTTASKPNQQTYDLGWGSYSGPIKDGLPHGNHGKIIVTKVHEIDLRDVTGEKITVYPGDVIETKYVNGELHSGEVKSKDGSSQLFSRF